MKIQLRYKIVLEGTYEIDPLESGFDTADPNEIAAQERDWVANEPAEWLMSDDVYNTIETTEVIILPI